LPGLWGWIDSNMPADLETRYGSMEPTLEPETEVPAPTVRLNRLFADYTDIEEVDSGFMGMVYKARHKNLDRVVALKLVKGNALSSDMERAQLRLEGKAIALLQHPNIVTIYECNDDNGSPYLALEWVEGGTLRSLLDAEKKLPVSQAVDIVMSIAQAMTHAHNHGVIHRDLKPGNILLTHDGVPKVADFGVASIQEMQRGIAPVADSAGTPAYMAPEQLTGSHPINQQADQFALGAVFFEMLLGRRLRENHSDATKPTGASILEDLSPLKTLPRDIAAILRTTLAPKPEQRYASMAHLYDDLERWKKYEPIAARPHGVVERLKLWAQRKPAIATLTVALLALVLGGSLWLYLAYAAKDREFQRAEAMLAKSLAILEGFVKLGSREETAQDSGLRLRLKLQLQAIEQFHDLLEQRRSVPKNKMILALGEAGAMLWELGEKDKARQCIDEAHALQAEAVDMDETELARLLYFEAITHEEPVYREVGLLQAQFLQEKRFKEERIPSPFLAMDMAQTVSALGKHYGGLARFDDAATQYQLCITALNSVKLRTPLALAYLAHAHVENVRFQIDSTRPHLVERWLHDAERFFQQEPDHAALVEGYAEQGFLLEMHKLRYQARFNQANLARQFDPLLKRLAYTPQQALSKQTRLRLEQEARLVIAGIQFKQLQQREAAIATLDACLHWQEPWRKQAEALRVQILAHSTGKWRTAIGGW
jgi:tRNA A-37 threonylcarbamoyl transferase component Bud32